MSNLIFSPHTDDAIFSLGDYILHNERITIASAFSGVPTDDAGYKKHTNRGKALRPWRSNRTSPVAHRCDTISLSA